LETWDELAARGEPLRISCSTRFWGSVLALALGFVGLVVWDAIDESAPGVLAAGLLAVPFVWMGSRRLLIGHPVVVVEKRGVYIDRLGKLVPWDVINGAATRSLGYGPDLAYLDVDREWAKEHTQHLRAFGLVLPVRNGHTRLSLPRGLEVPASPLAFWIDVRPYDPQGEHLVAVLGVDKLNFVPLIDPSCDEVVDLVLRVAEGKRAHVVLSLIAPPDELWLEIGREGVALPVSMAEHRGEDEVWRREIPDVATAAQQAIAWIRQKDVPRQR
jgi:hypothetical protein